VSSGAVMCHPSREGREVVEVIRAPFRLGMDHRIVASRSAPSRAEGGRVGIEATESSTCRSPLPADGRCFGAVRRRRTYAGFPGPPTRSTSRTSCARVERAGRIRRGRAGQRVDGVRERVTEECWDRAVSGERQPGHHRGVRAMRNDLLTVAVLQGGHRVSPLMPWSITDSSRSPSICGAGSRSG
jgi:hypothetical protein